jgi:hypothetical protein
MPITFDTRRPALNAMTLHHLSPYVLGMGLSLFLASCGGPEQPDGQQPGSDSLNTDTSAQSGQLLNVGGRLFSLPSPVQTAIAIRKAGLKYRKDLTTPLDKGEAMTSKAMQSVVLGLYGADMAYVTVHKDGQRALATMQAVEKLGQKLELTNAFDRALLDRFKTNLGNEDSLLRFSGTAFRAADAYLKNNDRNDVSTLILAGGWVGSLHLTLADPSALKDQALLDRIGDQKNALDGLVELLGKHVTDPAAAPLVAAFKELQGQFAGIQRTYTFEQPVTDASKQTTFINSRSTVTIPAETIEAITKQVTHIRSLILA